MKIFSIINRLIILGIVTSVVLLFLTSSASAAAVQKANNSCTYKPASSSFLAFPSWDKYITTGKTNLAGKCTTPDVGLTKDGKFSGTGILQILLAVIDILMRLVGLIALGFIVFGGIKYVTSQGSPEGTKDAQGTVLNALIGIGIATIAVAVVSFLGSRIG